MKTLLYDLETYPSLGYFWPEKLYEVDIIEEKERGGLLGFGYKWAHENKVHWLGLPDSPKYKNGSLDDSWLTKQLFDLINSADYYIAHNGKSFDNKVANTLFLIHGLGPPDKPVSHDTKQIFKQNFRLPSNKLDEIGRTLQLGRKVPHTGKKLWFDCMAGDKKAWKMMEKYCRQDVTLLSDVWDIARSWVKNPPNWNLDGDRPKCCPACGSAVFIKSGFSFAANHVRQKYKCFSKRIIGNTGRVCGHIWRGEIVKQITSKHWKTIDS